jgi:hypothetical protein
MAVTLNASLSTGLVQTADTSGNLNLQSNGTTVVAVTSTGASVTGLLAGSTNYTGFKNRIINGGMVIDQRNAGASVTLSSTGQYPVDRFPAARDTTAATVTAQQSSTVPTGFTKSILWTTSTGAAPSAGDDNFISHRIEGFNFADFGFGTAAAQSFTLSFWVRSSVTGTYGISLNNDAANRCFMATYTISAANTYEYKTITVPGDTTGTWLTTNGIGLRIFWDLGAGTSRSIAASSAWGSTYGTGLTGGVKLISTTGATFYITGVQLEKGSTATSFDYRPYGTELALCQRYYYNHVAGGSFHIGVAWYYSASEVNTSIKFPVTMRTAPTLVVASGTDYYIVERNNAGDTINTFTIYRSQVNAAQLFNTTEASGTVGQAGAVNTNNASASISFSAEL